MIGGGVVERQERRENVLAMTYSVEKSELDMIVEYCQSDSSKNKYP